MELPVDFLSLGMGSVTLPLCYVSPKNPSYGFHFSLPFVTFDYIMM